jgi:hypothetical protein
MYLDVSHLMHEDCLEGCRGKHTQNIHVPMPCRLIIAQKEDYIVEQVWPAHKHVWNYA